MKLSEAIREGAKIRSQNFGGSLFCDGKSCALGAAYEFAFGKIPYGYDDEYSHLRKRFPNLGDRINMFTEDTLESKIIKMNDLEQKTREQIAEFLEGIML